jgi:transposase
MFPPALRKDDVVVMDNLGSHKVAGVKEAIERAGATLRYLPGNSPGFNPIEQAFAKLKAALRKAAARTFDALNLERPLRLHLLSSAVRVQSIRRSGTLRAASRQRPQRRWVGERAEADCRTIQREGLVHLFPG